MPNGQGQPGGAAGSNEAKRLKRTDIPALDDVLVALQRSFSRLSTDSARVDPSSARALISGPVHFELSVNLEPGNDYLYYDPKGALGLKLSGKIEPDIRIAEPQPEAPGQ